MKTIIRLLALLWLALTGYWAAAPLHPAQAGVITLLWKPYLQQLTDTSVIILWVTQNGAIPQVQYGPDTSYSLTTGGSARTTAPGTIQHRVQLTGLQPNTRYYYKIFTDGEDLLPAETLSFQTAPVTGSGAPFVLLVFGDYGKGSTSQIQLRDQMALDTFNFILTTGDNAYPNGTYAEFDAKVFAIYQTIFSRAGLFPTPGNHDYNTSSAAPYLDIFDLPPNAWRPTDQERYYSFDYGNLHVVALDSNTPLNATDSAATDDIFDWLRADLNQTTQPWKIVAFHHAAYSTGLHGSDSRVQAKLVPIFEQYGVDLVFTGHDHIYQRSQPLNGGQITTPAEGGIVYVVSGGGSRVDYSCGSAAWVVVAYCSNSYGIYSRVSVNGSELLVEAVDHTGAVRDTFALSKSGATAVTGVTLSPAGGLAGLPVTLTASASPLTATLPISYFWQATSQTPLNSAGGATSAISYTWTMTGLQTITVTATNAWGSASSSQTLTIGQVNSRVYLPVILRPASSEP